MCRRVSAFNCRLLQDDAYSLCRATPCCLPCCMRPPYEYVYTHGHLRAFLLSVLIFWSTREAVETLSPYVAPVALHVLFVYSNDTRCFMAVV